VQTQRATTSRGRPAVWLHHREVVHHARITPAVPFNDRAAVYIKDTLQVVLRLSAGGIRCVAGPDGRGELAACALHPTRARGAQTNMYLWLLCDAAPETRPCNCRALGGQHLGTLSDRFQVPCMSIFQLRGAVLLAGPSQQCGDLTPEQHGAHGRARGCAHPQFRPV
jgi:hypothetical protein